MSEPIADPAAHEPAGNPGPKSGPHVRKKANVLIGNALLVAADDARRELLSRKEAAAFVGVSLPTLDRLDAAAKLPRSVRVASLKKYRRADLQLWLDMDAPDRAEFEARVAAEKKGKR